MFDAGAAPATAAPTTDTSAGPSAMAIGLFGAVALALVAAATIQLLATNAYRPSGESANATDGEFAVSTSTSTSISISTSTSAATSTSIWISTSTSLGAGTHGLPDLTPDSPEGLAQRPEYVGQLFDSADGRTPVASVVVVEDVMVTSASAVQDYSKLWLKGLGQPVAIDINVVGVDRFADIAVLASPVAAEAGYETTGETTGETLAGADDSEQTPLDALASIPRFDLGAVTSVVPGDTPVAIAAASDGVVIAVDDEIVLSSGHTAYSAIITSIPFEDHLAGAPLTTSNGDLIGIVVNAVGAVVAALPVDDVVRLTKSLLSVEDATNPGYAINLSIDASGSPVVHRVDPEGPFAGMLSEGDVVVAIDGVEPRSLDHLTHMVRQREPGQSAVFSINRANARFRATLTLDNPHLAVDPAPKP